jgi:ATP-binding cassette subfamily B protein
MNYQLKKADKAQKTSVLKAFAKLSPLFAQEKKVISVAMLAVILNAALNLTAPRLMAHAIDTYLIPKDYPGVLSYAAIILGIYALALITSYLQTRLMGEVGQRVLFRLRNAIFEKIQALPVGFFNQNKTGDLISRINNDTEKINIFFSQSLVQFFGNIFLMLGAGGFLVALHWQLGLAALAPAGVLLVITQVLSPWIKRMNLKSSEAFGLLNASVQENIQNFKVIIAFNRRDFFKTRFNEVNQENYKASIWSGIANTLFTPIYGLASQVGQLIVLGYGISLILAGQFTLGLLISFLSYTAQFYNPLRQLAALWANFQAAMASWDRVHEILQLENNLNVIDNPATSQPNLLLEFQNVAFAYPGGDPVLHDVNISLEAGKTYALVGPTGGGKSTTASLMARLFDPTAGTIFLHGQDIRSYSEAERTGKIGFILQDAVLFSGTVADNVKYGNAALEKLSEAELTAELEQRGLGKILARFDAGLQTQVGAKASDLSLGQKQLLAFMRAILRDPELLILDEATANIDTVTEQLLEEIVEQLPTSTTRVIIAHRLNTIRNADSIYFVNQGTLTPAGSIDHALEMLLHNKRES